MITNCTCWKGKDRRIKNTILQTLSQGLSRIIEADVKDFICTDIQGNTNKIRHSGNISQHVYCLNWSIIMSSQLTNFSSTPGGDQAGASQGRAVDFA